MTASYKKPLLRLRQKLMGKALLKPQPKAMVYMGPGSSAQLAQAIGRFGFHKVLVVTDKPLRELGVLDTTLAALQAAGVEPVVFDGVEPDPTEQVVDAGIAMFKQAQCDSVLAFDLTTGARIWAYQSIAGDAWNMACFIGGGANCPAEDIQTIYSKPQIFEQCSRWLRNRFPNAELVPTASSALAVQRAADMPNTAAIGSDLAGEIYGVARRFEKIQDNPNNITRFLVIGNQKALPSGDDKTTIMFVTAHKPGALVDVLAVFRDRNINLSHIDKRPSRRENWEYAFFIDCEAHQDDANMRLAIDEAKTHCLSLKVLGSYPRARRVL